jgi:hypothetical protein
MQNVAGVEVLRNPGERSLFQRISGVSEYLNPGHVIFVYSFDALTSNRLHYHLLHNAQVRHIPSFDV